VKRGIFVVTILLLLLVLGAVSASSSTPYPQQEATYVGSQTCRGCHPTTYDSLQETLHPWKLRPKDEANIVGQFPVTDVNGQTWTLDDVDWVIGAKGTGWKQRYIKIIDGVWRILPIQWNLATQEWVPYHPDNWMERDYKELCAGCHTTGYDVTTKEWSEPGVWCEACHGPGSQHVAGGFAGEPGNRQIVKTPDSETCGQCHVRGHDKDTGVHGWPVGYVPGGSQHIEDVYNYDWSAKRWWFDNPADESDPGHAKSHHQQYMEWMNSKHAMALEDLKASGHAQDFCLRCHSQDYRDDPENVTLETAQYSIECVTCHTSHDPGAAPHQLSLSLYDTCVQCHTGSPPESGKFEAGATIHHPMKEMFEGTGFPGLADIPSRHFSQAENGPVCSNCHFAPTAKSAVPGDISSHLLKPVMPGEVMEGEGNSCTSCHTEEEGGKVWLQDVIDRRQADIHTELDAIQAWLDANADQSDTDAYKTAYTAHSMVASEGSFGVHNFAYAKAILGAAKAAIGSPDVLEAVKASTPPTLDGDASDAAWADAPELEIPSMDLKLKAVYTDQDLYVLATWSDPTFSLVRGGSWIWDGTQWLTTKVGNPEVGPGMSEDRITFMWNMTVPDFDKVGCMSKCHGDEHPGYGVADEAFLDEGNADMWHMKAARSLPATSASQSGTVVVGDDGQPTAGTFALVGYCDDKWVGEWSADNAPDGGRFGDTGQGSYSHNRNADKTAPMYVETDPADYIDALTLYQSEIDAGEAVEVAGLSAEEVNTIWAKYAAVGGRVPERILRAAAGSRADVTQAAVWSDGVWTSEFKRALDTGHPEEDVIFDDLTKSYSFGVATMDNTGGLGHKTGGLKLSLVFRAAAPAEIPAGRDALTARVFIDYRCDRFFQDGLDISLSDVPVTISFPDGSSATAQTTSFGMVYFAGFDAAGGLTVSVDLPDTYRGYDLENCPADSTSIDLSPSDFHFGFTSVLFGAKAKGEATGP